jgi:GR25 family glycosyltransferase involved in LPS biosynthesis
MNSDIMEEILLRKIEPHLFNLDFMPRLPGVIGCYASHVRAIMNIDRTDDRLQLIMEDDIQIKNILFFRSILKCIKNLPNDWDILAFDVYGEGTKNLKKNIMKYPRACFPQYYGAQALLINTKKQDKIIKILEDTKIKEYDCLLFKNETAINTYIMNNGYCSQYVSLKSDITVKL